ncbi:SDR family NAD(P)-dependent oxidoreductase [Fictibacillus phosphorivorans]|uniref:SDR family NAD(P)-dependent oxidoreductase n=1 Tax=Fictibacillus phosphorivorans TaxID=1221500 RepID=UPI003CEB1535
MNKPQDFKTIAEMVKTQKISPSEGLQLYKQLQTSPGGEVYTPKSNSSGIYYTLGWVEHNLNPAKELSNSALNYLLVFDYDDQIFLSLSQRIKDTSKTKIILIKKGKQFFESAENVYEINPEEEKEGYVQLFSALKQKGIKPDGILYFEGANGDESIENQENMKKLKIFSFTHLLQTLLNLKMAHIHLLHAYYTFPGEIQPQVAALSGFLKSARQEIPGFTGKTIEIVKDSQLEKHKTAAYIWEELRMEAGRNSDIRYEEGKRYVSQMKPYTPAENQGETLPLKMEGVYLITGGMGGLGYIFAQYLAKTVKAKLVLSGRSSLTAHGQEKLQALNRQGAEAVYFQADISHEDQADELVSMTRSTFGGIDGIIHSAGITRDSLLSKKSRQDIKDVLGPKVYGTLNLDRATKGVSLDFFVLFSSLSAILGNTGQSDYAYANSFMNYYALYRQQQENSLGKTLSINWPLWQEGGLNVEDNKKEWLSAALGMDLIDNESGYKAFEDALRQSSSQFIVFYGNKNKLGNLIEKENMDIPKQEVQTEHSYIDKDKLSQLIFHDLIQSVNTILNTDKERIDIEDEFSNFGFDSISLTKFSNHLNKKFKLDLMPSIFFEYSTLHTLIKYLLEEKVEQLSNYYKLTVNKRKSEPIKNNNTLQRKENFLLKQLNKPVSVAPRQMFRNEPVAIIGMNGAMPQSNDLDEFWDNLVNEKDLVTEIPLDRWDWREYYGDPKLEGNRTFSKYGAFMNDVDTFDPLFFGISPKEADFMDPQQRIFMQTVWKTIEDAGYKPKDLAGTKTALYVGVATQDYNEILKENMQFIQPQSLTGMTHSVLANRISYLLDLKGPSHPVDTACSSALYAVHHAVEAIQSGRCEMAIAGGINIMLTPTLHISESKAGMLSPDGRCKTFDKEANGYVRGEGVGAVLLKPLSKAEEDGDHIYAIVKATEVNHGGRANSLTAPNASAQADLLVNAYERANIDPNTVTYIETHGTGTSLGDPVEINGLKKAFNTLNKKRGKESPTEPHCWIGSVKTNIGHLETAAGIAGLLKVLLSIKYKKLPASLHLKQLNPYIQLENSPFSIVTKTIPWEPLKDSSYNAIPRRAGVSSFGFGGANAHIVLEEYKKQPAGENVIEEPQVILLSAKNKERLKDYVKSLLSCLSKNSKKIPLPNNNQLNLNIQGEIIKVISEMLNVNSDDIAVYESFADLGLDKVSLNRLAQQLSECFKFELPLTLLQEYPSIEEAATVLEEKYKEKLESLFNEFEIHDRNGMDGDLDFSLENIAYTLQIGREEMEERLALVVSSKEELHQRLVDYLENDSLGPFVYQGNVKKNKSASSLLVEGREGEEFVRIIVEDQRFSKLAHLWTTGVSIDWNIIHENKRTKRISLPTYPFAKNRYWVKPMNKEHAQEYVRLHPMIHENTSTFSQHSFQTELHGSESFFRDHIVNGQVMLPGVASLEMARAAVELGAKQKVVGLRNVVWMKPVIYNNKNIKLSVSLIPGKDKIVNFEISSVNEENEKNLHAQGKVVLQGGSKLAQPKIINLNSIKNRCNLTMSKEEVYKGFEHLGFQYGTTLQSIDQLDGNGMEALAMLNLPESAAATFSQYVLHPSLLDGALQAVEGLLGKQDTENNEHYLPFSVGEISIHQPLTNQCYAYVKMDPSSDSSIRKFEILIANETGEVLIRLKDFTVRSFEPLIGKEKVLLDKKRQTTYLYKPEWQRELITQHGRISEDLLLFIDQEESSQIRHKFKDYKNLFIVSPGARFEDKGFQTYQINPEVPADYEKLLSRLKEGGLIPGRLLHLWSYGQQDAVSCGNTAALQKNNLYSLFFLSKALLKLKIRKKVKLIYAYHSPENEIVPAFEAVNSFLKSVQLENSWLQFKTVNFTDYRNILSDEDALRAISNEFNAPFENTEAVRYKGYERYVLKFIDLPQLSEDTKSKVLKRKGVYLITGGLGSLGMLFADYLARKVQARIVLTGRSEITDFQQENINKIQAQGSQIIYRRVDMSDREEVFKLIEEIKENFGEVNGVIHSSGVIQDSLFLQKTKNQMENVLAAKVTGTVNLDEATKNENIDFFVVFSSLSAILGNLGQSDYSFANSFMDQYVLKRDQLRKMGERIGKSLSINWPYWENGGMSIGQAMLTRLKENFGVVPLKNKEGIKIFEDALQTDENQICVFAGIGKNTAERMGLPLKREQISGFETSAEISDPIRNGGLEKEVEAQLIKVCASILNVSQEEIEEETDLSEYGMDSIMMMTMLNQLEKSFGHNIPPEIIAEQKTIKQLSAYFVQNHIAISEQTVLKDKELSIQSIVEDILQLCSDLLLINKEEIGLEDNLSDYGVDSVMMISMLNRLEELYHHSMEPNVIAEHNTVLKLANYISGNPEIQVSAERKMIEAGNDEENMENGLTSLIKQDFQKHPTKKMKTLLRNKRTSGVPEETTKKIAVIGMSARFPKSNSLEEYWKNLKEANSMVTEVPSDRWKVEEYFSANKQEKNKTYSKWGGFIEDVYSFDSSYFKVSDDDALVMDPQHRILLELTDELFSRAGYSSEELSGTNTGLFLGGGASSYIKINDKHLPEEYMKRLVVNSIPNMMAARISDFYNLKGVSQTIDTACSSSLVSIHQACQNLLSEEMEMAIAGGIELLLDPAAFVGYSKAEVLSDDGKCYVFDEKAKGFVLGEGAGLVLLKRLDKALEDGDQIFGVIMGSAVNNDGRTMGLTVPNLEGQKEVIEKALYKSKVSPENITYLEAHGTGTLLGDPIEIRAASQIYEQFTDQTQYCAVGSVKSNMGHLARAAGIASFIKVILSLYHKQLPPTLNCTNPHPRFKFSSSPFYPITELKEWNQENRRAGISSFGFGGTNCHMIIEELDNSYSEVYEAVRQPLPIRNFNRRSFFLEQQRGQENLADHEENTFDGSAIMSLLKDLESGNINVKQAAATLNADKQ